MEFRSRTLKTLHGSGNYRITIIPLFVYQSVRVRASITTVFTATRPSPNERTVQCQPGRLVVVNDISIFATMISSNSPSLPSPIGHRRTRLGLSGQVRLEPDFA